MIDALIIGRLHGKPQARQSRTGNPFVTAKVRTPLPNGEVLFVNVIAWRDSVQAALLALDDGDAVALSGELTPKLWHPERGEPRIQCDLTAHAVLSEYHVMRKRKTVADAGTSAPRDFDDSLDGIGS